MKSPSPPQLKTSSQIYGNPFKFDAFEPPIWLSNAHLQTILPNIIVKQTHDYRRELFLDSDELSEVAYDFLDADEPKPKAGERYKKPLVILFHGMEGSSQSHYARTLGANVKNKDWHFVVGHFRTCGGVAVDDDAIYHAGDSLETHHMLQTLAKHYETIYAVGVSLGGNLLAKYMADYGDDAICKAAMVVSAPLDLPSATTAMKTLMGRNVYTPYLLNPILEKVLSQHLTSSEMASITSSQRIQEFDAIFTAPRLGYRSPYHYYRQASALPHLLKVTKPTFIVTAKDDPFLGIEASAGDVSDSVILYEPDHGGHVGFVRWRDNQLDTNWMSETALQFFDAVQTL